MNNATEQFKPKIIIEDYRGFKIRACRTGFLAESAGRNLGGTKTIQEAINSVDSHLAWEAEREAREKEIKKAEEQRRAVLAEEERKADAIMERTIAPIKDYAATHGLSMLRRCVAQLEWEEKERLVPENVDELIDICERIAWKLEHNSDSDIGSVDVDRHGVTTYEYVYKRHEYLPLNDYTLEEFIDSFGYLIENEE